MAGGGLSDQHPTGYSVLFVLGITVSCPLFSKTAKRTSSGPAQPLARRDAIQFMLSHLDSASMDWW